MTPLDAMKQALEAMQSGLDHRKRFEVCGHLRFAIAELESAEPVAWMNNQAPSWVVSAVNVEDAGDSWTPLFTHPAQSRDEWKEAVIDELVVCGIYNAVHDSNPRKAIQDAIDWNVAASLDPLVSEAAQQLQTQVCKSVKEGEVK